MWSVLDVLTTTMEAPFRGSLSGAGGVVVGVTAALVAVVQNHCVRSGRQVKRQMRTT